MSELAAITGLTLKNTSGVVKELRERGWIELQREASEAEVVRLLKERGLHALIELLAALGSATAAPPR